VWFFKRRKWGMTLPAARLILAGLLLLVRIDIQQGGTVLASLAVAAGMLIVLDR
jgi:hypothetical protein